MEDIEKITSLFYVVDEYNFFNKTEYEEIYYYLNKIYNNECNNLNIKFLLENNKLRSLVYKTISFNKFYIHWDNDLYKNILKLLYYRDLSFYKLENNIEINILFDNKIDIANIEELRKIDILNIFDKKNIILFNNQYFINELFDYCVENKYNLIYNIENVNEILNNKYICQINIDDISIDNMNYIVEKCSKTNMKELHIIPMINNTEKLFYFRKEFDKLRSIYNLENEFLYIDIIQPGRAIGIDKNNKLYLKLTSEEIVIDNDNIELQIEMIKKILINRNYILPKCINCEENILCLCGFSEKECGDRLC